MKLLSLFVISWVTIFINVHSEIGRNVGYGTIPRFCSSGQHFIFLHSQQVLHTIMSTEGRTTFNERRLMEKSFNTLVIRGRLCFDRSIKEWSSSSTQRKREAFHALHVPRRSLPRYSFCRFSLGLFFHLNVSNVLIKQKSNRFLF